MGEYECNAILVPTRKPICVPLACYDAVPMTSTGLWPPLLHFPQLLLLEMQQQILGTHTAVLLTQQVRSLAVDLQLITLAKANMLHPKNFCFSCSSVLAGFSPACCTAVKFAHRSFFSAQLLPKNKRVHIFPCIIIECAHNHKEFRHPVTVSYSENNKCDYDFLGLLAVKFCPFHNLSVLQIAEEKIFFWDKIVESYLYINPLLHYALLTLTSMKSHGKGEGR